jgi:tetratricopeptide (TPR) repeat protein
MNISQCPRTVAHAVRQFLSSRMPQERAALCRLDRGSPRWRDYAAELRLVFGLDEENSELCRDACEVIADAELAADVIMSRSVEAARAGRFRTSYRSKHADAYRENRIRAYFARAVEVLDAASERMRAGDYPVGVIYAQRGCTLMDHALATRLEGCEEMVASVDVAAWLYHGCSSEWIVGVVCIRNRLPLIGAEFLLERIRRHGQDRNAWLMLADCYCRVGRLYDEQRVYEMLIERRMDNADSWNRLGVCHFDQKNYDEAIHCYRRAIALRPDYALAYNNMGESHYRRGQIRRAMGCYGLSISLNAEYHEVHRLLGDVYRDLGLHDKFLECYRRAAALNDGPARSYLRKIGETV